MEFLLSAHKWSVKGFYPWVPLLKFGTETGRELLGVTDWIPASVPGGVHYDLFRAGPYSRLGQNFKALPSLQY